MLGVAPAEGLAVVIGETALQEQQHRHQLLDVPRLWSQEPQGTQGPGKAKDNDPYAEQITAKCFTHNITFHLRAVFLGCSTTIIPRRNYLGPERLINLPEEAQLECCGDGIWVQDV